MKKIFIVLSFVFLLITIAINSNVYASSNALYYSGDGTTNSPYIITTEEHLKNIKYNLSSNYKLGANIFLSGEWSPIEKFYGKIDGDLYTINDMVINVNSSGRKVGFIGHLYGTIKNLYFNSCVIKNGVDYTTDYESHIGIIAGYCQGIISASSVSNSTIDFKHDRTYVGGVAGTVDPFGYINHTDVSNVTLDVTGDAGGLVGVNYGMIDNCTTSTTLTYHYKSNNRSIGGLVGTNGYDAYIDNSESYGYIYWNSPSKSRNIKPYIGKLIGYNAGDYSSCYSGMGYNINYYYWNFIGWYNQSERCFKHDNGYVGYNT